MATPDYNCDIIELEEMIRQSHSPRDLYGLFEWICKQKESGRLTLVEYWEVRDSILNRIRKLNKIKEAIEGPPSDREN